MTRRRNRRPLRIPSMGSESCHCPGTEPSPRGRHAHSANTRPRIRRWQDRRRDGDARALLDTLSSFPLSSCWVGGKPQIEFTERAIIGCRGGQANSSDISGWWGRATAGAKPRVPLRDGSCPAPHQNSLLVGGRPSRGAIRARGTRNTSFFQIFVGSFRGGGTR